MPTAVKVSGEFGSISARELDVHARFSRSYRDAGFPLKEVSYVRAKRLFDIVGAVVLLVLSSPIMFVTAILVTATSPGGVLFRQVRVGRGGRFFWCYKFRSMCADAESRKPELLHLNEASGPVFKMKRDPRLTRVGAVIRKLSIDELPQLLNVLLDDMSLVGPRPPLPDEVERYTEHQRGRLAVAPGLTCLWQVSGRSGIEFCRWVEMDLEYIRTMSFATDLKLVLRTIPAVLGMRGAQ